MFLETFDVAGRNWNYLELRGRARSDGYSSFGAVKYASAESSWNICNRDIIDARRQSVGRCCSTIVECGFQIPTYIISVFSGYKIDVLERDGSAAESSILFSVIFEGRFGQSGQIPSLIGSHASGNECQEQDKQNPFVNPIWLLSVFVGLLGGYSVVSNDYGPVAFIIGAMLAGGAFVTSAISSDLIRHLTSFDCHPEDVGILTVVVPELKFRHV